ncbi:MAG: RNA polymerase sigma factor [Thiolinea sp.]
MPTDTQTQRAVENTAREHWGYLYACLVKQLSDFDLAEDVLQEAIITALEHWPQHGIPEMPRAWLLQTAKRKAIDHLRRRTNFDSKRHQLEIFIAQQESAPENSPEHLADQMIDDERLRLIFTCCHPALPESAHVALTLRTLGGLSTTEIARAFLLPEPTLAQRLVRAKNKIRKAGIPYKVPEPEQWPERVKSVLAVIYLIFNEGYSASNGGNMLRADLCEEAIRLGQMIHQLIPDDPEVMGLLALMLLHDSRRLARTDAGDNYLTLEQQNRDFWDQDKISTGQKLLKHALSLGKPGMYQLQAAISALHAEAETFAATDWLQIRLLYNRLYALNRSPVVQLNAIVALSFEQSAEVALGAMNEIDFSTLQQYQPYHSARADLLKRSGQLKTALEAYQLAIDYSQNQQEQLFLERQMNKLRKMLV